MLEVNNDYNKTYAESQVRNSEKKWRESMNAIVKEDIDRWSSLQTDQMKIKEDLVNMDEIDANLKDRVKSLESKVVHLDQYGRRPSIEINGVSEDISQSSLEAYVAVEILHPIGVKVGYWDIVACHRLKKRDPNMPATVVIRFVNQKHAVAAVKNRHKLKFLSHLKGIFITDNLCLYYRSIFDDLFNLKQQGVVNQVWSYSGKVSFKSTPNHRARGTRVGHIDELTPSSLQHLQMKGIKFPAIRSDQHIVPSSSINPDPTTRNSPISSEEVFTPARRDHYAFSLLYCCCRFPSKS